MRVIRIGERYSISTDEVEMYDLLPVGLLIFGIVVLISLIM